MLFRGAKNSGVQSGEPLRMQVAESIAQPTCSI
jgi:hypothetical protein